MRLLPLYFLLFSLAACSSPADQSVLEPFSSDGCSLFPDKDIIAQADWCSCCVHHDVAYWRGGSEEQRKTADKALRECVRGKTGDDLLASVMYEAVRFGGSPYFPNWYRWGYGWPYERMYKPLTENELSQVAQRWSEFNHAAGTVECADPPSPSQLQYLIQ